ncbi:MAG: hypothetical protein EZS28_002068 [Streblomastix strix]|uniref:Uncharacterized protein n=1 Tax=Streblomastix strix TaxID=222440 RepID=A0A5J4X5B5_9EUKA|nr:MAG: hypothetical protein EZS28_002068 [Streblomastix strix]
MEIFDQMKILKKNKMFEIDAHSNAIWLIDEQNQEKGLFAGIQAPLTGLKLTQTRIASVSADGTVKLQNVKTDGIPGQTDENDVACYKKLKEFKLIPQLSGSVVKDQITRYVKALVISQSTGLGNVYEQDQEIFQRLYQIYSFLRDLHNGRNLLISFPSLPTLVKPCEEQIEEEGAKEEIDSQFINDGDSGNINQIATQA